MRQAHKNRLFTIIQTVGLDPARFEAKEDIEDGREIFTIRIKDSNLMFIVRVALGGYSRFEYKLTRYGQRSLSDKYLPSSKYLDIEGVYELFEQWLREEAVGYFEDETMPDMWKQLSSDKSFTIGLSQKGDDVTYFSQEEVKQLKQALSNYEHTIEQTFKPTAEQMTIVKERLNYLAEATQRLNKTDWRALAISTVITISTALALDTERGRQLFELFKEALSYVQHLLK